MNRTYRTFVQRVVVALVAGTLLGCSALRRPGPTVDRTHDSRIRSEVEAMLSREPSLPAGGIRVEVDGAIVVLHGSVSGIAAWRCAIRAAQLVEGVRTVTDFLVLEPGPREVRCLAGAAA